MGKTIGLHPKHHHANYQPTNNDIHNNNNNDYNSNHNTSNFNMNNSINNNTLPPINSNNLATNNNNSLANNSLNNSRNKHLAEMEAKAANIEAMVKARYFAFDQKRTMPPRINPLGILMMILMGGLIFIGLTITIVANWPGLATIGENRLKIAGPILLVLGILGCVCAGLLMGWWARKRNRRWEREMTERAHKHISQSQEPIMDSSYQSSLQVPGRQRNNQGVVDGRMRFGRVDDGRRVVSGLPISEGAKKTSAGRPGEENVGSIPDPHRKQKQHRMLRLDSDLSQGSTNQSFSAGEADMHIPGISFTQLPDQSGVRVVTTTTKTTTTKKVRRVAKKGSGGNYGNPREDPIRDVLSGNGKRLNVLIKAQQGTAVKISPSPTPPTGGHSTRLSMDTEI